MRLRSITIKGITRYQEETRVDFESLGSGLVAVAGANGAGKTTILESAFAGLYGYFPSRNTEGLYGCASGKDAKIEVEIQNGSAYRGLTAIDAIGKKTEAYLFREGQPVTSGKVREYAAEIARIFGSDKLVLSACLSAQNKAGAFLSLDKAARKDLVCEVLDVGGLQVLAEAARERSRVAESRLASLRGTQAAHQAEAARLVATMPDLPALKVQAQELKDQIATTEGELVAAREIYTTAKTDLALAQESAKARDSKVAELEAARRTVSDLEARLAALAKERKNTLSSIEIRMQGLDGEKKGATMRAEAVMDAAKAEASKLPEYQEAEQKAEQLLIAIEGGRAAESDVVAKIDGTRLAIQDALDQVEAARTVYRQAEDRTRQAADLCREISSAGEQAALLQEVPCGGEGQYSGCKLIHSAKAASDSVAEKEHRLEALRADLPDMVVLLQQGSELEARHREVRDSLSALDANLQTIRTAISTRVQARDAALILAGKIGVANAADARIEEAKQDLAATLSSISEREAAAKNELRSATESLDARALQITQDLSAARSTCERLQAEVDALKATDLDALTSALTKAETDGKTLKAKLDGLQAQAQTLAAQLVRAEENLQRRLDLVQLLDQVGTQTADLVSEVGDWSTLERAFGRDGIQALLIDAAGPELSALTNDLLHSSFSDRFEVSFVTQIPKADGKGQKEVFDVKVIDHERGREGSVDSLSGGEKVVISEAISLALAIYTGRHGGHTFSTLFRDETAGALDPDNAHRYISMLRKARELSGAYQIIFIAQQKELWEQADAVLWCEGGKVGVRA